MLRINKWTINFQIGSSLCFYQCNNFQFFYCKRSKHNLFVCRTLNLPISTTQNVDFCLFFFLTYQCTYVLVIHVFQHAKLSIRAFSVDGGLERSSEFLDGDFQTGPIVDGRAEKTTKT